jgi:hypothetical protein
MITLRFRGKTLVKHLSRDVSDLVRNSQQTYFTYDYETSRNTKSLLALPCSRVDNKPLSRFHMTCFWCHIRRMLKNNRRIWTQFTPKKLFDPRFTWGQSQIRMFMMPVNLPVWRMRLVHKLVDLASRAAWHSRKLARWLFSVSELTAYL